MEEGMVTSYLMQMIHSLVKYFYRFSLKCNSSIIKKKHNIYLTMAPKFLICLKHWLYTTLNDVYYLLLHDINDEPG